MGKFQLRKPKIISKNFPEVGSHIDNVSKSLNDLVFSYSVQVDRALQKKHMMMALSSLVLILVVGSFISPRGKADIVTFYPETCLGGWSNPRNAEREPESTSNADPSQFDDKNSAILDKNTRADIYCGNFNGTFNDATTPKKIIVSLAITNKDEITIGVAATSSNELATTTEIIDGTASTTQLYATTSEELLLASSTGQLVEASTTQATTTRAASETSVATEVAPTTVPVSGDSFVEIIVGAVTETLVNIFNSSPTNSVTDTVVVPPPPTEQVSPTVPAPQEVTPTPEAPVSLMKSIFQGIGSLFVTTVFAQEGAEGAVDTPSQINQESVPGVTILEQSTSVATETGETLTESSSAATSATVEASPETSASSSQLLATTTASSTEDVFSVSSSTIASTTEMTSTSSEFLSQAPEESQNNFLEILYTFDGVTWTSLGELNEISMKYRTFEIPLSASSTWSDMSLLQIKVTTKSFVRETPVTYLDGIKVEVLYESTLQYSHPDFVRDTILTDETIDGMRIVTIINNENNEEETWYMYLDEEALSVASSTVTLATTTATSTLPEDIEKDSIALASSTGLTEIVSTSTLIAASATSTSTDVLATSTASSTPIIAPLIPKNKWFKLEKKEEWASLSPRELVEEIKKEDKENKKNTVEEDRLPDFAKDIIKRIKGALLNAVIVQVEKDGKEELWLYDLESGKQQKIEAASSTAITIAKDMQIGVKDTHLFWLSEDRSKVYAFNLVDKSVLAAEVPPHDATIGERGRVSFSGIAWEVIVGAENFAFYSEATGEVFSDDDSRLSEALRQRFNFDSILDVETISNLNMSVTATTTE